MNLPNKLTLLRIILIPIFMVVLYWGFPGATYAALAIFIIASLTDLLDGKIARKYNLVTDFGKFADPLADKMLVTAAMLWFVEIGQMPAWMLLIVICREFAVSGLRMIASDKGRVIAAGARATPTPWRAASSMASEVSKTMLRVSGACAGSPAAWNHSGHSSAR